MSEQQNVTASINSIGNLPPFSTDWPNITEQGYRTQNEFNNRVSQRLSDIATTFNSVEAILNNISTNIANNQNNINTNTNNISNLTSKVNDLNNQVDNLNVDYSNFTNAVNNSINQFSKTIGSFQNNINNVASQVNVNSSDIADLKGKFDSNLWNQVINAYNNMQGEIKNALSNYDAQVVQPKFTQLDTTDRSLASKIDNNTSAIGNVHDEISSKFNSSVSQSQSYTDTQVASISGKVATVASTVTSLSDTVNNNNKQINSRVTDAINIEQSHYVQMTNVATEFQLFQQQEIGDREKGDNDTLNSAKQYTDGQIASNNSKINTSITSTAQQTLQSANGYTDDTFKKTISAVQNAVGASNAATALVAEINSQVSLNSTNINNLKDTVKSNTSSISANTTAIETLRNSAPTTSKSTSSDFPITTKNCTITGNTPKTALVITPLNDSFINGVFVAAGAPYNLPVGTPTPQRYDVMSIGNSQKTEGYYTYANATLSLSVRS